MKYIYLTLLIIICLCSQALADNYFVKDDGNDSNTGRDDAQAWLTIAKVNGFSFADGDDVYFKCGDTWSGTQLNIDWSGVDADNYSIIGAYEGNGDIVLEGGETLPIINGNSGAVPSTYQGLIRYRDQSGGYLIIENLNVRDSGGLGIEASYAYQSYDHPEFSNVIIRKNTVYNSDYVGINIVRGEYCTITENVVEKSGHENSRVTAGISITQLGTNNNTVSHNRVFGCHSEGIGVYDYPHDNVVEYNEVYDNRTVNIYISDAKDNIARYNLSYTSSSYSGYAWGPEAVPYGLFIDNELGFTHCMIGGNEIYGNLVAACKYGIQLANMRERYEEEWANCDQTDCKIYNNTVVDCTVYNFRVDDNPGWSGNEIKNNISYTLTEGSLHCNDYSPVGVDWGYNCFDDAVSGNANDNAVIGAPTLAKTSGWRTLTAGSVDGTDFAIEVGSNCINAGTNLGNDYDNTLNVDNCDFSTVPSTIEILDQDDHGANWEIGADIYPSESDTPPADNDCSSAIAHYILDANMLDSTTNDNDVTATGSPSYTGEGVQLDGSTQYGILAALSDDISDISVSTIFEFDAEITDDDYFTITAEWDEGASNERVWCLVIGDDDSGDDDLIHFKVGYNGGADSMVLKSATGLDPNKIYSATATYDSTNDDAHLYIYDGDPDSENYGDILNGASGETDATLVDIPGNTQNVEATDFLIGAYQIAGSVDKHFDGTIYEVAVYASEWTQASAASFAVSEYADLPSPAVETIKRACGGLTSAGNLTFAIAWDQRVVTQGGNWTVGVTFDYPVAKQTATYSGRWNEETGWTQVGATDVYYKTTYTEPTLVKDQGINGQALTEVIVGDGDYASLGANEWDWADWNGATAPRLYINVGSDPSDDEIVPTPYETYVTIACLAGWRQNDFDDAEFSASITKVDSCTIKNQAGDDATVTNALNALDAVDYPSTDVTVTIAGSFDLSSDGDFVDWDAFAAIYSVPGDTLSVDFAILIKSFESSVPIAYNVPSISFKTSGYSK